MSFSSADTLILKLINDAIEDRIGQVTIALLNNSCADMADYRFRTGQLKALSDMRAWTEEARKSIFTPHDDTKQRAAAQ
jgi:hypothetical protein